ncbi:MAG: tail fiber domain-containing protein, partial [Alphaproteobacteria bacterium]|nr:tail fiber domain-containing protein [Alphaproteobacteria bacterium]
LVSTTSTNYTHGVTAGCGFTDAGILLATRNNQPPLNISRMGADGNIVDIRKAGTAVGSISVTTTATAYNTSSDYRLKEDYQPIENPTERLAQLQPRNFAWKCNGERTDGFIAHEVQEIVPQAVTGEKDGEEMQSIDHSKLVPLLTAALQEALLRIALLEEAIHA